MKLLQSTTLLGCLLLVGCQTASSLQTKMSKGLFKRSESSHTFSADSSSSSSPSAMQLSNDEFRQGEELLKKGNLKQAEKHFVAFVKKQPQNAAAHHRLGYIADKNNNFTMAEIHYITALKLDPNNADIACDLGYSYLLQNRLEDAKQYLEEALSQNPQHKAALLNLAALRGKQGDYDGALALFRQAGDEQQAQENIANLFPQGRPANRMTTSRTDQSTAPQKNPYTQSGPTRGDFRKEMAERSSKPLQSQPHSPGQERGPSQQNYDLNQLDPRKIPPEQINDIFAQIDRDAEQKQRAFSPRNPGDRITIPSQPMPGYRPSQEDLVAQTPQRSVPPYGNRGTPASNSVSSVPGDLPTQRPTGYDPQNSSQRPLMTQRHPAERIPSDRISSRNIEQVSRNQYDPVQQTYGTMPPRPPMQSQTGTGNLSAGMNSADANIQKNTIYNTPGPSGSYRQTSASQPSRTSYQDAVAIAVQMGMNAGPGQMFPLNRDSGQKTNTGMTPLESTSEARPYLSNPNDPAQSGASLEQPGSAYSLRNSPRPIAGSTEGNYSSGARQQNQHPFQHLPIQPSASSFNSQSNRMPSPETGYNGMPSQSRPSENSQPLPMEVTPSGNGLIPSGQSRPNEIQDWPYAPGNPRFQQISAQEASGATRKIQQMGSETPWLNQSNSQQKPNHQPISPQSFREQSGFDQSPQRNPEAHAVPGQWPYSPQAADPPRRNETNSYYNGGNTLNPPPQTTRSSQRDHRSGGQSVTLPQVVPGVR